MNDERQTTCLQFIVHRSAFIVSFILFILFPILSIL
jgi:hypothetical protein